MLDPEHELLVQLNALGVEQLAVLLKKLEELMVLDQSLKQQLFLFVKIVVRPEGAEHDRDTGLSQLLVRLGPEEADQRVQLRRGRGKSEIPKILSP